MNKEIYSFVLWALSLIDLYSYSTWTSDKFVLLIFLQFCKHINNIFVIDSENQKRVETIDEKVEQQNSWIARDTWMYKIWERKPKYIIGQQDAEGKK